MPAAYTATGMILTCFHPTLFNDLISQAMTFGPYP